MNLLYSPPRVHKSLEVTTIGRETFYRNHLQELHRLDGPAIIRQSGEGPREEYYYRGVLHRVDGPARIWADGSFEYYLNGRLAGGGPTARRFTCGDSQEPSEEWRNSQGQLHRLNGPALTDFTGAKFYYKQGRLHRSNGPAVDRSALAARKRALREREPFEAWYLEGQKSRKDGPAEIYGLGAKIYWLEGEIHREDGPAIIHTDRIDPRGYRQAWLERGQPHRLDGPAIVDALGTEYYYLQGVLHNSEGAAIIMPDGDKDYYLHGLPLTKKEWLAKIKG